MEITKKNGTLKTLDELYEEAKKKIVYELDTMDMDDALYLGNEIRDRNNYNRLYKNDEEGINEVLEGESPWDILNKEWNSYSSFFTYDYDFEMTDDVWYDFDTDEIAGGILDDRYRQYITSDIQDIVDEYEEAREEIENYNPYREKCAQVIAKYVNCEADVADLLQMLDKLVKDDSAWEE